VPEAFVLFKTEPACEREVYLALTNHDNVVEVHALYGEYDMLVRVTADSAKNLTSMLIGEFRRIKGVRETQTLIAVEN
jgi:DNA-binding Lrp family transcriptional regulator